MQKKRMKAIPFDSDMVKAIQEKRKTTARFPIKPQPEVHERLAYIYAASRTSDIGKWKSEISDQMWTPPYHAEDILYVQETWGSYCYDDPQSNAAYFLYRADYPRDAKGYWFEEEHIHFCDFPRWRSPVQMPKEAARYFLRVKSVRVEHLKEITEEGAVAEGIWQVKAWPDTGCFTYTAEHSMGRVWSSARECFRWGLWGKRKMKKEDYPLYGWDADPWVWVVEYEQISKEEALQAVGCVEA